jgi:hypothetical protein
MSVWRRLTATHAEWRSGSARAKWKNIDGPQGQEDGGLDLTGLL